MLKNYLLVCVRNLVRQRLYSAIKVLGLALGIGCCIPILLLVYYEWSHDSFHENGADIYRVLIQRTSPQGETGFSVLHPTALAPALAKAHPGVVNASGFIGSQTHVERGEKKFWQKFALVDPAFFADL